MLRQEDQADEDEEQRVDLQYRSQSRCLRHVRIRREPGVCDGDSSSQVGYRGGQRGDEEDGEHRDDHHSKDRGIGEGAQILAEHCREVRQR